MVQSSTRPKIDAVDLSPNIPRLMAKEPSSRGGVLGHNVPHRKLEGILRVMDDNFPECEFKGPCRMKDDCIATCGGKPSRALCIPNPSVDTLQCCCLSN
ncbi:hypothetical protein ISN44_As11g040270 [Arabidopsis suecica]|uniref:Uncharacterized protein n=1 Tax=Arabidopsis suecica TaxID=45249 RepID=A0A8T1ZFU6_ARASU|nr:hypothetical protein ISN44_As11g040270 [Arabidopsis suecica]